MQFQKVIFKSIYLLVILVSNFCIIYSQSGSQNYYWRIIDLPVKINFTNITSISPIRQILCGRFILVSDKSTWRLLEPQPPVTDINDICTVDDKIIWISENTSFNEANIFKFDGTRWIKVKNPIIGTVVSLYFSANGTGWLGGDRETAYYDGSKWKFIEFPKAYGCTKQIFGKSPDETYLLLTDGDLFKLEGGKWKIIKVDEPMEIIKVTDNGLLFALTKTQLLTYTGSSWSVHSSSRLFGNVLDFTITPGKEIWAVGHNGLILKYDGIKWEKQPSPTENNLNSITMTSNTEGFIAGDNGILLFYSNKQETNSEKLELDFNQIKLGSFAKTLNDEYGTAISDFNNDGYNDILAVCIFEPVRLYINQLTAGNKPSKISDYDNFLEEALQRKLINKLPSNPSSVVEYYLGVGVGDIENDGDDDVYLCNLLGDNKLFRNDGSGYFKNISDKNDHTDKSIARTNAAIFGDVDNDGDLDLFITNEIKSNKLFMNDGYGNFEDITSSAHLTTAGGGMCASFGDIDNDGDLDLCVSAWIDYNRIYRNDFNLLKKIVFTEISGEAGIKAEKNKKSNSVLFADYDNDGDLDLFITSRLASNRLYNNNGKGIFYDVTEAMLGVDSMRSYGASMADFNNDGFLDLYIANIGLNAFYLNHGGEYFKRVSNLPSIDLAGYGTGTSVGDIDNDGDIDLYSANYIAENSKLFINNRDDGNYIKVTVEGIKSNRNAVGVKVWLYEAEHLNDSKFLIGYREINGGCGYASHNSREIHFGTGNKKSFDLVVYFPASGIKKYFYGLTPPQKLHVRELDGLNADLILFENSFLRFIHDPDKLLDLFNLLLVVFIIAFSFKIIRKKFLWRMPIVFLIHLSVFILYLILNFMFAESTFFFSSVMPALSCGILLLIIHLYYEQVILKRKNAIERINTRNRIARDLHDDLASTLSSTLIYSEVLKNSIEEPTGKQNELTSKISRLLLSASNAVTDIIWSVSPYRDVLQNLIQRIQEMISENCSGLNIKIRFHIDANNKQIVLSDLQRRNIYLIFREAVNNSLKYSSADEILFSVHENNSGITLELIDNGKGFNVDLASNVNGITHGNGIRNMKSRANEIGCRFEIISSENNGTKIKVIIK